MKNLVLDKERKNALELMEKGRNVFLTGKAGTGKSTLSKYFLATTKKKVLVLGSTGIAAINVGGQTVHSAMRIMPRMQVKDIERVYAPWAMTFKYIDAILLDEVSMVRADLLDCMNKFLQLNGKVEGAPMGGIQLIMVGDICQLPPVVTEEEQEFFSNQYPGPYFFDSHCYADLQMAGVELQKVFRQKDPKLVKVLNLIRTGEAKEKDLRVLNNRHDSIFERAKYPSHIYLATRNKIVDEINTTKMAELAGKEENLRAVLFGRFPRERTPAEENLVLKIGARVMLLNNDRDKRWVNGDIGTVVGFGPGQVNVELSRHGIVGVNQHKWETVRQSYDPVLKVMKREITGSFTQYPIRPAWAITIHKSQGQTFENVAIDFTGGTFAHGQAYVALSRSTSLPGLVLANELKPEDIMFDERVRAFMKTMS
ncbi:MAG: DEAD/DEAH box helicase [Patescibacteria group bacterium]